MLNVKIVKLKSIYIRTVVGTQYLNLTENHQNYELKE